MNTAQSIFPNSTTLPFFAYLLKPLAHITMNASSTDKYKYIGLKIKDIGLKIKET